MAFTTALVTGASSGIGYEIARRLAAEGHNLVLVARRRERLDELARELMNAHKITVTVVPLDLARPGAVDALHQRLQKESIPIDMLVNNAGLGHSGALIDLSVESVRSELDLNIGVLTEMCQRFGADMSRRGLGKILNIASAAAFQPGPWLAVYAASKAYVLSFSEALRQELKESGISVTVVCPGPVATEFHSVAGTDTLAFIRFTPQMSAAELARHAVRAMHQRKSVVIPGLLNRINAFLPRFLPRNLVAWAVGFLMRPR